MRNLNFPLRHSERSACPPSLRFGRCGREESLANARIKVNMTKKYWVYILTNKSNTLYIGITNNLRRRIHEHKNKVIKGFTKKYNINKLIYLQEFISPYEAIAAEKKIKGWSRKKKMTLIKKFNSEFRDLSASF